MECFFAFLSLSSQLIHRFGYPTYTRRQINLFRKFFANFSVYSQQIVMKLASVIFVSYQAAIPGFGAGK